MDPETIPDANPDPVTIPIPDPRSRYQKGTGSGSVTLLTPLFCYWFWIWDPRSANLNRVGKTLVFYIKKKPGHWVFFSILVFLGIFPVFCPEERFLGCFLPRREVSRVFSQFQEYF
jgi:hypothetical protein